MQTLEEAESYSKVLFRWVGTCKVAIKFIGKRRKEDYQTTNKEIKRDIRRNSMKIRDVSQEKSLLCLKIGHMS